MQGVMSGWNRNELLVDALLYRLYNGASTSKASHGMRKLVPPEGWHFEDPVEDTLVPKLCMMYCLLSL